ncbi:hypothetical protein BJ875DRAFT_438213 [Amylocarpus encephaloides]|uniref:Uncharacterized protein n=1 Tax=Amylocarpus encephaloides TaxID=45428 RepID=A0A9P7YPQ3_9HELO|nr:hypothetical protein BJ875DRAFT_438213 [Amylocarpus encephaloides]
MHTIPVPESSKGPAILPHGMGHIDTQQLATPVATPEPQLDINKSPPLSPLLELPDELVDELAVEERLSNTDELDPDIPDMLGSPGNSGLRANETSSPLDEGNLLSSRRTRTATRGAQMLHLTLSKKN